MRTALLLLKLAVMAYLAYLLLFLATAYEPALKGYSPPLAIFVIDTVNLYIHEAGHLFFKIFGQWVYMLGGSLFQVLLPLALLIVVWRQNLSQIWYPGFWLGESMVNVSAYIKDAPYRQLRLLARGLTHDWNWLLSGDPDEAEVLGTTVFVLGLLLCGAALGTGVYYAVRDYQEHRTFVPSD